MTDEFTPEEREEIDRIVSNVLSVKEEREARIKQMIADKNYGGAWQAAEDLYGTRMDYMEFLRRYVWKD